VMSVSVCLSFCEHISSAVGLNFTKFSVAYVLTVVVARFSASALRCASLLYTSVIVDDVIFSRSGSIVVRNLRAYCTSVERTNTNTL